MPSLNKIYLMGNLTRSPELKYTPGGTAICEFGLAVNRRYISNGIQKDETTFIDINVWQRQAEICKRRLQKGSLVMVEGRLRTDQWVDKDTGKKRSKIVAVAEKVSFLAVPPKSDYQDDYDGNDGATQQRQSSSQEGGFQQKASQSKEQSPQSPPPPLPEDEYINRDDDGTDENVPF